MTRFRKNKQGLFICEECGMHAKTRRGLIKHINVAHNNIKKYYDKWIKEEGEGICKSCGAQTKFYNSSYGYLQSCSEICANKQRSIKRQENCFEKYNVNHPMQLANIKQKYVNTCLRKFGVKNPMQLDEVKEKSKKTCLKSCGVEYPSQSKKVQQKSKQTRNKKYKNGWFDDDKMKQTKFKNHGYENYNNKEKIKQTCQERYGVENPSQLESIKKQKEETCFKHYGVFYANQDPSIFERGQKARFEICQYQDTDLWYQGSYELDFLKKYYDKYPQMRRGPSVKYEFNGKHKIYHPDFYISSLNLIVEIKSTWTYDEVIDPIKEKATIASGFKYLMILDKNYTKLAK